MHLGCCAVCGHMYVDALSLGIDKVDVTFA
jgi:hypothetical protein